MAAPLQALAVQGSEGLWLNSGPTEFEDKTWFKRKEGKFGRAIAFSRDGSLFAWQFEDKLHVTRTVENGELFEITKTRQTSLMFSPCNTHLAVWESYIVTKDIPAGTPNLEIYHIESGQLVKSYIQKNGTTWCPQWSIDEKICARIVNNEIHFFENNQFDTVANKLHMQKVDSFVLAKTSQEPYHVAVHVSGSKGQPSFVKLFRYPHLDVYKDAVAHKSFFKAEKVEIKWSHNGKGVVILTSVETSETSYYGEQGLHYASVEGDSSLVPLAKNGPVYSVEWNPSLPQFCVVYGFMPAKATLFNTKCEPVFDFGTGPRNVTSFNAHGNILCLAGFGNLRGNIELWDVKQKKLISQIQADDTTYFEWAPDGQHFVTATTAPRLRVDNNYKVWHYSGNLLHTSNTPARQELWQVTWQPGHHPEQPVSHKAVPSIAAPHIAGHSNVKAGVYRPPSARGRPSIKLHEDLEPPSNVKKADSDHLSKQAAKNKKKREAKKAARQEETSSSQANSAPSQPAAMRSTGDPEKEKKAKNITKKLQQIAKLKELQQEGKTLEKNQLEKLETEDRLLKELKELTL